MAKQLGVSISTVRRLEGDRLHPKKDREGVHGFDPIEVRTLAEEMKQPPKADPDARGGLSPGEIAARAFERFERRETLAEVVIGLRLPPDDVRKLYHEWLMGLAQGELTRFTLFARSKPAALPPLGSFATHDELVQRLALLPAGVAVRIAVARDDGEHNFRDDSSTRKLAELGGFVTHGPVTVDDIRSRYGLHHSSHRCRVTAYRIDPPAALLWEVFGPLSG